MYETKIVNKIEKRKEIIIRTKSAMQTFIPQWQYEHIKEKYSYIMHFIRTNYNKNPDDYTNYNNELVAVYDFFQNDDSLKYLITRFFNMSNMSRIIDTRKEAVDEDILFLLKQDSKNDNYYANSFNNEFKMPFLLLWHYTSFIKQTGIYWIIFKNQFNYFIDFLTFIYKTPNYKSFQKTVYSYLSNDVMWLSDAYESTLKDE